MTVIKDDVFFKLIHDYFKVYLPIQRKASKHTIKTYRESFDAFLEFVKFKQCIKLYEVGFDAINHHILSDFLDSLEEKGCSISTRNHRMSCIRAFYKYAAKMEPMAVIHWREICKVPAKNRDKPDIIEYMSEAAVKVLLATPDSTEMKGLRDQFFMVLLYDTGARIDELVNIRIQDIHLGSTPTVTVTGKGSKTRSIPLMEKSIEHYRVYKEIYHPTEDSHSKKFVFPTTRGNGPKPIHQDTARKFIYTYGVKAKEVCNEVPNNVHPHLFRHSRAMHLYQRGMDLTLISQWLGHSKVETTLIYAHADTEKKRLAIEKAFAHDGPLSQHLDAERYMVTDEEQLKRLYGLR